MQKELSGEQKAAFYKDIHADDLSDRFLKLVDQGLGTPPASIIDIGGGVGFFAERVAQSLDTTVTVLDSDPESVARCKEKGIPAIQADALHPDSVDKTDLASFNLILHHIIADSESTTNHLQRQILNTWREKAAAVFVNEYIYESSLYRPLSGRLIYLITSSKVLSAVVATLARLVPSLKANTLGVGVRFRSDGEWRDIFNNAGLEVVGYLRGREEKIQLPWRLLLINSIRRDSYLLRPLAQAQQ